MAKILGLCRGWFQWNGGGGFSIEKKGAMRKSDPTLNGALVHKEIYGKAYLPD
jgi:hypothetical protein